MRRQRSRIWTLWGILPATFGRRRRRAYGTRMQGDRARRRAWSRRRRSG